ncbi:MAG TPA: HAMP domain-containing sensor histidine kinase, partial [Spirochaetia bacterium]|nr:HAMP domain-containing sensor histidine kinase [Spirochaetia bacterium]
HLPVAAFQRALPEWKKKNPLVAVPFLLSPHYGILWPDPKSPSDEESRRFLEQNADFLSGKSATAVLANIAVLHKEQVLAEAKKLDESSREAAGAAVQAGPPAGAREEAPGSSRDSETLESQQALDAFAQSPEVQAQVYEQARREGEQVNARVAQPTSKALLGAQSAADLSAAPAARSAPARTAVSGPPAEQPSQYVVTSRLLGQIASQGEYGIIPRFVGEKLTFLFWNRQTGGRILGCEIAAPAFRERIAGVLPSTYSPVRILTVLDDTGAPLAAPPGSASRDWRRPFVSQEIGESLPRWEVASYLTDPASITTQARSASMVIWVLVLILFVSVAGGGTMVLTSLYGEMRLAQKKAGFVANVSHELKTPLTSIGLFVELLRRAPRPDPRKRERYLALMAAETERLGRLINNVLDFSSMEKNRKKYAKRRVDLGQIAREVTEGQRVRLEGLGFIVRFRAGGSRKPAERFFVDADPEALKQVLINLLSNAEKYSYQAKEIEVEVTCSASEVAAHVRDRGIGVAPKDRERIFLEFVRVDDSLSARVPGTGLGLTIARRIARDHGGDLVCDGREGEGSDFVLRLPAVQGEGQLE